MTTTIDYTDSFIHYNRRLTANDGLSYSAGFALCLSLAVMTALMAIAVLVAKRPTEERQLTMRWLGLKKLKRVTIWATILLASTAILTWLCAKRPYEIAHKEPLYFSIFGIIVTIPAALISLFRLYRCLNSDGNSYPFTTIYVLSTSFLVVPGLVVLTMYFHGMDFVSSYSYLGPMRIMGFTVDSLDIPGDEYFGGYTIYFGMPEVGWGREWACPEEKMWCQAFVKISECQYRDDSGDSRYHLGGKSDATDCVRNQYNISYWEETVGFPESQFNQTIRPDQDPNWPIDVFYGDCSSCTALDPEAVDDKVEYAQTLKWIGGGLALAGAGVYLVLGLHCLAKRCVFGRARTQTILGT